MAPTSCGAHHGRMSCFDGRPKDAVTAAGRSGAARRSPATPRAALPRSSRRRSREFCRLASNAVACGGGFGDRLRRRPMQLIQVDAIDAEPAQAGVAFGGDVGRRRGARCGASLSVPRPNFVKISGRRDGPQLLHRAADDLFGVARSVDRARCRSSSRRDRRPRESRRCCRRHPGRPTCEPPIAHVPRPMIEISCPLLPSVRRCIHAPDGIIRLPSGTVPSSGVLQTASRADRAAANVSRASPARRRPADRQARTACRPGCAPASA